MENRKITYTLTRESTRLQTGFFATRPNEAPALEEGLALLRLRPMDDFLHQYVLGQVGRLPKDRLQQFLNRCKAGSDPVCRALAAEYLFLTRGREHLEKQFTAEDIRELCRHTPLIYLRSALEPDQALHGRWIDFFRNNMQGHQPLASPDQTGLPLLTFDKAPLRTGATLAELAQTMTGKGRKATPAVSPEQTADTAEDRLKKAGVELGRLMRHESSLSPIGLLRSWHFATHIENRRNQLSLSGEQTGYGRGLTLNAARASLMMEIVERCSAFASVSANGLENFRHAYPLRYAPFSELAAGEAAVMNPADLALEVSYQDQGLHWVQGETPVYGDGDDTCRPMWIPAQCLFLFCNLDEPSLFSGLGSTGLASGNTLAQAKVSALLEIVERHQAATVPYDLSTCFHLVSRDPGIAALLEAYRQAGVNLWFQDITPKNGIPCCRCFVKEKGGQIHTGAAAHLDARRAIVAAITETPCPFPKSPATQPVPPGLTLVGYENLPDYSTGDAPADLALLETLFLQNNLQPCYVDLTRADIGLPVVKAVVPGMEVLGDFDDYSRVHPELYQNYLFIQAS
ncbi:MAG: YcaO-like family protein [Thermodesulfobacteriota bacterium]|nr:YcaO-like family protein [Thermodesulfobacteriota bacterium]